MRTSFTDADGEAFAPDAKVGLLATLDPQERPHLTLITTLTVRSPSELVWGQFCEGESKHNVRRDPRVGFLVMTLSRQVWQGTARWTRAASDGEEFDQFNRRPMFRYNSYFGIHTVHYLDLRQVSGPDPLSMGSLVAGHAICRGARVLVTTQAETPVLNPWSSALLSKLTTLKFIAWQGEDGYPTVVPAVPCIPAGSGTLVFAPLAAGARLRQLQRGQQVAVYGLNLAMESVLVRGRFAGFQGVAGGRTGRLDLDWAYNSMPPKHGPIYPRPPLGDARSADHPA